MPRPFNKADAVGPAPNAAPIGPTRGRTDNWRRYVLRALSEFALIVASILIALQVDNWNEARRQSERVRVVLRGVRAEVQANLDRVRDALPRRREFLTALKEDTEKLTDADRRRLMFDIPEEERLRDWPGLSPTRLDDAMFEAAKTSGALPGLSPELLSELTGLYARQNTINDLGAFFLRRMLTFDYRTVHGDLVRLTWRIQEEFFGAQWLLVADYREVLRALDAFLAE